MAAANQSVAPAATTGLAVGSTPPHPDSLVPESATEITQDILLPESDFADAPVPAPQTQALPRPPKRGGRHRVAAPPAGAKGRVALLAAAAGATVAAIALPSQQGASSPTDQIQAAAEPGAVVPVVPAGNADLGPGIVAADATAPDVSTYTDQLRIGEERAAAEVARQIAESKPLFHEPIAFGKYTFTSPFASRWGSFHGGIDMAAPLGTPIHAVTDGVVIAAEPASGYGHWVQVKAADGTVTMYGHMSSSGVLVQKGQQVTAGDVIALVGNEGFSTGPHLHFEVWKDGTSKIDPAVWLARHGIRLPGLGN